VTHTVEQSAEQSADQGMYAHILTPLDGSAVAAQALEHAVAIALHSQAKLTLVQVIPDVTTVATESVTPPVGTMSFEKFATSYDLSSMQEAWINEARGALHESVDRLAAAGVNATSIVLQGSPAEAILSYAEAEAIDLIVMSTHGRGGVARLIYGSVATQVLRSAPCPVLVVRARLGEGRAEPARGER
jgi:nucleotide-binding universal stress UspA family protein